MVRRGAEKNLPKTKNPVGKKMTGKKMTGNLGRNQVQALQPILRGETTTTTKKIIVSDVGLERLPTRNYKLKYSHVITHDATTLKDRGPRPAAPVPQANSWRLNRQKFH